MNVAAENNCHLNTTLLFIHGPARPGSPPALLTAAKRNISELQVDGKRNDEENNKIAFVCLKTWVFAKRWRAVFFSFLKTA